MSGKKTSEEKSIRDINNLRDDTYKDFFIDTEEYGESDFVHGSDIVVPNLLLL